MKADAADNTFRCNGDGYEKDIIAVEEAERDGMAQIIADWLLRGVTGNIRLPTAWKRFAREVGVDVALQFAPGKPAGSCTPALLDEVGAVGGIIYVNTAFDKRMQAAVYIHELAHLFLHTWTPPYFGAPTDALYYDGGMGEVGHDIARRVEYLLLETNTYKAKPCRRANSFDAREELLTTIRES